MNITNCIARIVFQYKYWTREYSVGNIIKDEPSCRHDWQVVNGMYKNEAKYIGEFGKGPAPYQVIGDTWIENRVCLKCHAVDDALDSYIHLVKRQAEAEKRRNSQAKAVYDHWKAENKHEYDK